MKKVIFLFTVIATAIIAVSCGHSDEPDPVKPDEITRVKDGNGKVFLENGVLVAANIDFTAAELNEALTEHEWYFDYRFIYDNHKVSPKMDLSNNYPTNIHVDGTIEYRNFQVEEGKIRDYSIKGKEMTVIARHNVYSSLYIPNSTFVIIALDMINGEGRMIMDKPLSAEPIEGYDANSTYVRSIWRTTPNN